MLKFAGNIKEMFGKLPGSENLGKKKQGLLPEKPCLVGKIMFNTN
jgi:hypothetical protein